MCSKQRSVIVGRSLTADKRDVVESLPPLLADVDGLLLLLLSSSSHSLLVCMFDHFLHVLGMHCIQDVEEVSAIRETTIWAWVRQISHDLLVSLGHGVELLEREFVVERHVDGSELTELHQLLVVGKHLLEEVPVDVHLRRCVELKALLEEFDEIRLGAELANQLRSHESSLLGALEGVVLHLLILRRHIAQS